MTQLSDDGKFYWNGSQWKPTISADGAWRWNGSAWVANAASTKSQRPSPLRIASWGSAGLGALVVGLAVLCVVVFAVTKSQGHSYAPGYLGVGLIALSLATLLVCPFGLQVATRRRVVTLGAIGAGVLFIGSCGGGIALTAAYPLPTPNPTAVAETHPSPGVARTPIASATLTPTAPPTTTPSASVAAVGAPVGLSADQKAKVQAILQAEVDHYMQLFAEGKAALGTTQYPDAQTGLAAFGDPNSAASRFSSWRHASGAETDVSFQDAFSEADSFYNSANEPPAISDWRNDMGDLQAAISDWVQVAVSWQISTASSGDLQAAETKVNSESSKAETDIQAVLSYLPPAPAPSTPTPTAAASYTGQVTGFGATDAVWNSKHTADSDFAPGAVYDADPTLPQINGHTGAKYTVVDHLNGHVIGYTLNLAPGTSAANAQKEALQDFPPDVIILWQALKSTCAQIELESPAVGQSLSAPAIGDASGMAIVEVDTANADGTSSYDPNNINEVLVGLGSYSQAADAPSC